MAASFHVERLFCTGWRKLAFTERNLSYCEGYVDALDSLYPSDSMRIVKAVNGKESVVREVAGKAGVHLN